MTDPILQKFRDLFGKKLVQIFSVIRTEMFGEQRSKAKKEEKKPGRPRPFAESMRTEKTRRKKGLNLKS